MSTWDCRHSGGSLKKHARLAAILLAALALGCSSDKPKKHPVANTDAGAEGSAGAAGAAGAAGTAGSGGSATGGMGGTGGSAGIDGGAGVGGTDGGAGSAGLVVKPLFEQHGALWNDYVTSTGPTYADATDVACDSTTSGTGPSPCLHAGELRAVDVGSAFASCANVTASDQLGAFDWVCDDSSGTPRVISTGLKPGVCLAALIDWSANPVAFRTNSVTITDGTTTVATNPAVWWANPVQADNDGGSLGTQSTIYVVTASGTGDYTFAADKLGLVAGPSVTLQGAGTNGSVIDTNGHNFAWLEADVDATGDYTALATNNGGIKFSVVCGFHATGGSHVGIGISGDNLRLSSLSSDNGFAGVDLRGNYVVATDVSAKNTTNGAGVFLSTNHSTVTNVEVTGNAATGLAVGSSGAPTTPTDLTIKNVLAASNGSGGIVYAGGRQNWLLHAVAMNNDKGTGNAAGVEFSAKNSVAYDIAAFGNADQGVRSETNNVLVDVLAANNGVTGAHASNGNVVIGLTSVNNLYNGVQTLPGAGGGTLMDIASVNNGRYGMDIDQSTAQTYINVATTDNANTTFYKDLFDGNTGLSHDNVFSGLLVVTDPQTSCSMTGTNPGVDSTCANVGSSDATLVTQAAAGALLGKVTANDATNASDTAGSALFQNITDWTHFDRPTRGWGMDGSAFPNADNQSACRIAGSGTTCRIWDFALRATDTVALRSVVPAPADGNAVVKNVWAAVTTQAACDEIVGAVFSGSLCSSTFLRNAFEVFGDGIGNDNGLCESGETCIVTPNIGAYQGHGNLVSAGSIGAGGTIQNVTLMRYQTNGY